MLIGKKVFIDAIECSDLEQLRIWRNKVEFRKYFREYRVISQDMQKKWYETKVMDDPGTIMFAIRDIESKKLLGCCGLCYINWVHRNADLSLYIGYDDLYIDNSGFAEDACKLLFGYAFKDLGLVKIWTEIYEFDAPKYELYKVLGFQEDGKLRKQYFYEGKWWSSFILSILCEDFK